MAEQDVIKLAREEVEAFNTGDWQRMKASLAPDAVYHELATQRRIQGPDQIVQVNQAWRQAFPDAKGTISRALVSGNTVTLEITWEGTQTGPMATPTGTLPPSGKRATVPAVEVVTIQDGKVKEIKHYFDLMGLLQQIGALPTQRAA
ncbi:MAG: ester cyclase [Chloroflexi bacterium]|nr:ester cyclase [Chloroflexota bacterium]